MALKLGPSSLPKLSSTGGNYIEWQFGWSQAFKRSKLWKLVSGELKEYPDPTSATSCSQSGSSAAKKWERNNLRAMIMILGSVDDNLTHVVRSCVSASEAWNLLAERFDRDTRTNSIYLLRSIVSLKYHDGEDLQAHVDNFNQLWIKMIKRTQSCNQSVTKAMKPVFESDETKGTFFLTTLPETMDNIIDNLTTASLTKYSDIEPKMLEMRIQTEADDTQITIANFATYEEFHSAFGHSHVSKTIANRLYKDPQVIPSRPPNFHCQTCNKLSKVRASIPTAIQPGSTAPFQLVHSRLSGPFSQKSLNGSYYYITFIDDYTRYAFIHLLKEKLDTHQAIQKFNASIKNRFKTSIQAIQTDNADEYCNKKLASYLRQQGIQHIKTPPYHQKSNGLAERYNRTITTDARSMIRSEDYMFLWAEAVVMAVQLRNIKLHSTINDTPHYKLYKEKPSIGHIKTFMHPCSVHIPKEAREPGTGLLGRAESDFIVGYQGHSIYRVYVRNRNIILDSKDVKFAPFHTFNQLQNSLSMPEEWDLRPNGNSSGPRSLATLSKSIGKTDPDMLCSTPVGPLSALRESRVTPSSFRVIGPGATPVGSLAIGTPIRYGLVARACLRTVGRSTFAGSRGGAQEGAYDDELDNTVCLRRPRNRRTNVVRHGYGIIEE